MRAQLQEIITLLPNFNARTIFDIGANVGQSSRFYRQAFFHARIYAFEPVPETFAALSKRFAGDARVECRQLAFGEKQASAFIELNERSVKSRIIDAGTAPGNVSPVQVETGDNFCSTHNIDHISFLKIDTEGYDLRVCKGFQSMLTSDRIDLLQVEAGLSPHNRLHVPFQAFKDYLEPMGYSVFRIYDQAGIPRARRCNIVFISQTEAHKNFDRTKSHTPKFDWL